MIHVINYTAPVWHKIEADWFETTDGKLVVLKDVDLGWTLMAKDDNPPIFIGCYLTLAQALGSAAMYIHDDPEIHLH